MFLSWMDIFMGFFVDFVGMNVFKVSDDQIYFDQVGEQWFLEFVQCLFEYCYQIQFGECCKIWQQNVEMVVVLIFGNNGKDIYWYDQCQYGVVEEFVYGIE